MILLHINTNNIQQATEVVDYLLEQNWVIETVSFEPMRIKRKGIDGKITETEKVLIIGKTKSLLFSAINRGLRNKFGDQMPALYSLPIVHMDGQQLDQLMENTAKV